MIARAAPTDKPTLAALMEPYTAELAIQGVIGDPAKFLDRYWADPTRHPYLIRAHGGPAGFALVNKYGLSGRPIDAAMAEFYITPNHRRQGWGIRAARAAFATHPGQWELWVAQHNTPARGFWKKATAGLANRTIIKADGGLIYRFCANEGCP